MPIAPTPGAAPDFRFVNASAEGSPYTKAMARHAIKAQDPAIQPYNARRNVLTERSGASHVITIGDAPTVMPEAGATLKNGRLLGSSINRSSVFEFQSGQMDRN